MLASPGGVGQMHIKTEPQEEEEPLSAIVTLQRQNTEWMERCLKQEAENEELKEDNKKLRERRGEGEREEKGITSKLRAKLTIYFHMVIFAAEYERSLEESGEGGKEGLEESGEGGKAGQEKGSWEAEDSPEKMCGR